VTVPAINPPRSHTTGRRLNEAKLLRFDAAARIRHTHSHSMA